MFLGAGDRFKSRMKFRNQIIPGHNYVTLMFCSRSPAVNKYLHMETKEKHMNIPRSIIHEPKTSDCGTAGALVVYPCNISFFFYCGSAGLREH